MSTRICALDDVSPGSAIKVEHGEFRLAVVRIDDTDGPHVYVIGDRCTHADFSLSEGEVDCDDHAIECWKHGAMFRLTDGEPTTLPATKATPTYAVTITDGDVYVELDA